MNKTINNSIHKHKTNQQNYTNNNTTNTINKINTTNIKINTKKQQSNETTNNK